MSSVLGRNGSLQVSRVASGHAAYKLLGAFLVTLVDPVETSDGAFVYRKLLDSL